jgi:hypothetical protein
VRRGSGSVGPRRAGRCVIIELGETLGDDAIERADGPVEEIGGDEAGAAGGDEVEGFETLGDVGPDDEERETLEREVMASGDVGEAGG